MSIIGPAEKAISSESLPIECSHQPSSVLENHPNETLPSHRTDCADPCRCRPILRRERSPRPVSYTHLDVYKRQLRIRLLAGTLVWIVISILVAGWGLGQLFHQHVEAQFDVELKNHLDQLTAQLILDEQNQAQVRLLPSDPRLNKPLSGLYWQIDRIAAAGELPTKAVLRSRSLWDETLAVPADTPADGEIHQHRIEGPQGVTLRVVERTVTIDTHSLRLMVAANESLMTGPIADFKGHLWLALGILGMGLTFAASMQVFVGLAPLRSMQDALGRVRHGDARNMEGTFPNEIMPLVNEFNTVLAQNAEVVERARTQAGNLAHALKTPLSVLSNAANAPEKRDDDLARCV